MLIVNLYSNRKFVSKKSFLRCVVILNDYSLVVILSNLIHTKRQSYRQSASQSKGMKYYSQATDFLGKLRVANKYHTTIDG